MRTLIALLRLMRLDCASAVGRSGRPSAGHAGADNAGVSPLCTTFTASGSTDDLAAFARALCENLRNLPLGELRRELQVLCAESVGRRVRPTFAGHLMEPEPLTALLRSQTRGARSWDATAPDVLGDR